MSNNKWKIGKSKIPCLLSFLSFLSFEEDLFASLAVCTAASADAASGVARRISHMSCWHSLYHPKRRGKLTLQGI